MQIIDQLLFALAFVAALGCGLVAGAFFGFSSFIMKALAQVPPAAGIAAMQSINVVVLRSWFIGTFLGTAAVCAAVLVVALMRWREPGAVWLIAGSLLYLAGCLYVTMAFNVPRNVALARVAPADPASAKLWADYVASWTTWNHVRTAASLAAAASFIVALAL